MSRSPYYPRRRSRLLQGVARAAIEDAGQSEPAGSFSCALCHADLPTVRVGELLFIQGSLGFVCKAPSAEVCPLRGYLAPGAAKE